jgi:hypothetical protein
MCREVAGRIDWSEVRREVDAGIDRAASAASTPDPETWGLLPEHVAEQERITSRGGNVGDR